MPQWKVVMCIVMAFVVITMLDIIEHVLVADAPVIHDQLYCRQIVVVGSEDKVLVLIGSDPTHTNGVIAVTHAEESQKSMVVLYGGTENPDGSRAGSVTVRNNKADYVMSLDSQGEGTLRQIRKE